jgi:hypothetical protein
MKPPQFLDRASRLVVHWVPVRWVGAKRAIVRTTNSDSQVLAYVYVTVRRELKRSCNEIIGRRAQDLRSDR